VLQTKIFMGKYDNDNIIYLNLAQISSLAMQKNHQSFAKNIQWALEKLYDKIHQ
jgi:hypothetical protein